MVAVTATVTGERELLALLTRAQGRAPDEVRAVVTKGALNIKNDWRQRWSGIAHAPALGSAVTFDVFYTLTAVNAEIGPDKQRRQGALANLIEFGSENNAPIPGGLPALQTEEPKFALALEGVPMKLLS